LESLQLDQSTAFTHLSTVIGQSSDALTSKINAILQTTKGANYVPLTVLSLLSDESLSTIIILRTNTPTLEPTSSPDTGDEQFTLSGWNLVMVVVIPFVVVMACLFLLIVTRKQNIQKHTKVAVSSAPIETSDPREERKEQEDERSVKPKNTRSSFDQQSGGTKKIVVVARESEGVFSEVCFFSVCRQSIVSSLSLSLSLSL
jgi:large-conductance mechanosensitive channel